ncbi:MAG TPA: hypothetical protein DIU37_01840, partial [Opitutae bacterium]|nr:hypothetical protein [Opitutae bacterium]
SSDATSAEADKNNFDIDFSQSQNPGNDNTLPRLWEQGNAGGIAAVVEDQIITIEELRKEVAPFVQQLQREARSPEDFNRRLENLSQQAMRYLVDEALVLNSFKDKQEKTKFKIPQSYIDSQIDQYIASKFNNDRKAFIASLKAQGKTQRQFEQEFEDQIAISYMRGQIQKSQAEISPEKIEQFYRDHPQLFRQEDAVDMYMITLKTEQDTETIKVLETTFKEGKVQTGEQFQKLARKHSRDEKRKDGGDWGWVSKEDLRGEIADRAFALKPGEHTGPIVVGKSTFFIFVKDKRKAGTKDLELVRSNIEDMLSNQLSQQAQERWLEGLRKKAYIK